MSNMRPDVANGKVATLGTIMSAFDQLPKALRAVLRDAPFSYDPRGVRAMWNLKRREGWTIARMAQFTAATITKDVKSMKAVGWCGSPLLSGRVATPTPTQRRSHDQDEQSQ